MHKLITAALIIVGTASSADAQLFRFLFGPPPPPPPDREVMIEQRPMVRSRPPIRTVRPTRPPTKMACSESPEGHLSWRNVDGRKCYYTNEPGVRHDRSSLYWPDTKPTTRTARPKREAIPLPSPQPLTPTPPVSNLTPEQLQEIQEDITRLESLTTRLNYYFTVLSSQAYLQSPSGALPLATLGPWVGRPIPPGLQAIPASPSWPEPPATKVPEPTTTIPPKPTPAPWWKRVWNYWWSPKGEDK